MYVIKIVSTRPNGDAPFYIDTPEGQEYQTLMDEIRSAHPSKDNYETFATDYDNLLFGYSKELSNLDLTQQVTYKFRARIGRDQLFEAFADRYTTLHKTQLQEARSVYNTANGHSTTVEVGFEAPYYPGEDLIIQQN